MEVGKRKITEIFDGHKVLEIPFFQRSYVWKEEQWERLLDDMYNRLVRQPIIYTCFQN